MLSEKILYTEKLNDKLYYIASDSEGLQGYYNAYMEPLFKNNKFEEAYPFVEGYGRVKVNGNYGFINETGERMEGEFPQAYDFANGCVLTNDDAGNFRFIKYINNKLVMSKSFYLAYNFEDGCAAVEDKYGSCFINKNFEEIQDVLFCKLLYQDFQKYGIACLEKIPIQFFLKNSEQMGDIIKMFEVYRRELLDKLTKDKDTESIKKVEKEAGYMINMKFKSIIDDKRKSPIVMGGKKVNTNDSKNCT
jgi:hypothetical protein